MVNAFAELIRILLSLPSDLIWDNQFDVYFCAYQSGLSLKITLNFSLSKPNCLGFLEMGIKIVQKCKILKKFCNWHLYMKMIISYFLKKRISQAYSSANKLVKNHHHLQRCMLILFLLLGMMERIQGNNRESTMEKNEEGCDISQACSLEKKKKTNEV